LVLHSGIEPLYDQTIVPTWALSFSLHPTKATRQMKSLARYLGQELAEEFRESP
jgi:hypothetical protein